MQKPTWHEREREIERFLHGEGYSRYVDCQALARKIIDADPLTKWAKDKQ